MPCERQELWGNGTEINGNQKAVPRETEIPITFPKTIYIGIFMQINRMRNGLPMYLSLNITMEMKYIRYI